jgi:hypothetical protein
MSLYDRYFSKINEEHMFKLIIKIMIDETGQNMEKDERFHQIFKGRYPLIFSENNSEEIIELNKILIDDVCFRIIRIINDGGDNPVNNLMKDKKNNFEMSNSVTEEEKETTLLKSSKRTKSSKNRFNYTIEMKRDKKLEINKLVIPYETNTLFINDTISVRVNNEEIYCQLKYKNKIDHREFFTYQPIHKKRIQVHDNVTIQFTDELGKEILENDIHNIMNSNNILLNEVEYLCLEIEGYKDEDYLEYDKIGLIKDDKIEEISKILIKTDKYLLCDKKMKDYDSIINLSLQNTIYCDLF